MTNLLPPPLIDSSGGFGKDLRHRQALPKQKKMEIDGYSDIAIEIFLKMTGPLPCDIFLQIAPNKFMRIFKKGDTADSARLQNYSKRGAQSLYILKKDRRFYIEATERCIKALLAQPQVDGMQAGRAIEELTEQTLYEIFDNHIFDEKSLEMAQVTTKSYVHWLHNDMRVLTQFLQLCRNETYMVKHSISTAVFSVLLARNHGLTEVKVLESIGLGALLHDIGMSHLPPSISDIDRKLTNDEWEQIKKHPDYGVGLTKQIPNCPQEVINAIEQHHEAYDGSGYPRGLKAEAIAFEARVVTIADCFSALTTKRGGRGLFSPEDAIGLMQLEKERFDEALLQTFEKLLAAKKKKTA